MTTMRISWLHGLYLLVASAIVLPGSNGAFIPGTSQTANGYDNDKGPDAVCWKSYSASEGYSMPNPLVDGFTVEETGVQIQNACPSGNTVSGLPPVEQGVEPLRTGRDYNYTVTLNVNLTSLEAYRGFLSDRGPGYIAMQILSCVAGLSGFCSPFVHEQAIARDEAALQAAIAANPDYVPPTTKKVRGNLHSGSHIHSGFRLFSLPADEGPIFKDLTFNIPQLIRIPGSYFTVVTVQMYFWDESNRTEPRLIRYDMANKLDGALSLTTYQDPAEILEVDNGVLYASYGIIVAAAAVALFMLLEMIRNMDHQVAQLSQGRFLIVFLAAAFTATAASFLMEPRNDGYCLLANPIIMVALHTIYAVTIGRLWRINTLISPLLLKKMDVETPWTPIRKVLNKLSCGLISDKSRPQPSKMHAEVSEKLLAAYVAIMVAPQVVLQILVVFLQPRRRVIDFNSDESTGRAVCRTEEDLTISQDISCWGFAIFALEMVFLLTMASKSRSLPSLFNESKTIFDSTFTSVVVIILGVAIIAVTNDPETSPSVSYLVKLFVVLSITINTSVRIVMPKLGMMWRGETVIVSQLVLNHQRTLRSSESAIRSSIQLSKFDSVASSGGGGRGGVNLYDSGLMASNHSRLASKLSELDQNSQKESAAFDATQTTEEGDGEGADEDNAKAPEPRVSFLSQTAEKYETKRGAKDRKRTGIVVSSDEAPSRRLLLKMVDLQEQYNRVTQQIMSGTSVSQRDWEKVRFVTARVGRLFENDVSFAWEEQTTETIDEEKGVDHLAQIKEGEEQLPETEEGSD